jgi:hypothetical protein
VADEEGIGSFQVALTTAGTAQQVVGGLTGARLNNQIEACVVKALKANTGTIYLGATGVSSTTGMELVAGDSVPFDALSINSLYFNGTATGDKIAVMWVGP